MPSFKGSVDVVYLLGSSVVIEWIKFQVYLFSIFSVYEANPTPQGDSILPQQESSYTNV